MSITRMLFGVSPSLYIWYIYIYTYLFIVHTYICTYIWVRLCCIYHSKAGSETFQHSICCGSAQALLWAHAQSTLIRAFAHSVKCTYMKSSDRCSMGEVASQQTRHSFVCVHIYRLFI